MNTNLGDSAVKFCFVFARPITLLQAECNRTHAMARVASLVATLYFALPLNSYGQFALLHEFAGGPNDGWHPNVIAVSGSTLFGTSAEGGDSVQGTIFSMNTDGTGFKLLHEFAGGTDDGGTPLESIQLSGSTLIGTTRSGGEDGQGTIFSINTDGTGLKLLHEFGGGPDDGDGPRGLTLSGSTLFGATFRGGDGDGGTIFSMNTDGTEFKILREFARDSRGYYIEVHGYLAVSDSTLFGTSGLDGNSGVGTIFSMNTDGNDYKLLHEFAGGANDGLRPRGGVTLSGSTLFGTTRGGGDSDRGTVYSINTDGSGFKLLHEFAGGTIDGSWPQESVVAIGSTLIGTTLGGGVNDSGTIFSMNRDGTGYKLLHKFADGENDGRPVIDSMALSGSTVFGITTGGDNGGTIFSLIVDATNVPGDYNGDGTVDAADYIVWRNSVGQTGAGLAADGNASGTIDTTDYNVWRSHFGQTAASASTAPGSAGGSIPAAPEPTTLVIAVLALTQLATRRRYTIRA